MNKFRRALCGMLIIIFASFLTPALGLTQQEKEQMRIEKLQQNSVRQNSSPGAVNPKKQGIGGNKQDKTKKPPLQNTTPAAVKQTKKTSESNTPGKIKQVKAEIEANRLQVRQLQQQVKQKTKAVKAKVLSLKTVKSQVSTANLAKVKEYLAKLKECRIKLDANVTASNTALKNVENLRQIGDQQGVLLAAQKVLLLQQTRISLLQNSNASLTQVLALLTP